MPAAERLEFRVMGSDATVVAVGGGPGLAQRARQRLDHLEGLWSRFRPDSEVSRMNAAGGRSTEVSAETIRLVGTAVEAWSVTRGAYDPTVLGDVLRAGYTVSFESLRAVPAGPLAHIEFRIGAGGIRVDALNHTVELPPGVGFDPGGIGKGLAADIVVEELMAAGAQGACVNVGGDLRVCGTPPDSAPGSGWAIDVDDPFTPTGRSPSWASPTEGWQRPAGCSGAGRGPAASPPTISSTPGPANLPTPASPRSPSWRPVPGSRRCCPRRSS